MRVERTVGWLLLGLLVTGPITAYAAISNLTSVRHERSDRSEKLIRCAAFFELISTFRGRTDVAVGLLTETSVALVVRTGELLAADDGATPEDSLQAATERKAELIAEYEAALLDQFGPAESATFRTYDLLMMQDDLKFCKQLVKAEGLSPSRTLPAR